ncbi:Fc.00g017180.m01.CDS01 [Cosmosporella sp. VM-42]
MKTFSFLSVLGLAGLAHAHMEMIFPPPFKSKANPNAGSDVDYSMTAPLQPSGADYPCKGYLSVLGTDAGKSVATFNAGETYNMTITGGANHGGGSCQASLSFDKGKSWTVIHSYVGGCPAAGTSSLDFKVPEDTPSGDVVFAWSWFNQIGNREMYMNCAAVTIAGGSKKRATAMSSRPAMFIANTNNGCSTKEGSDLSFPNPGPDVSDESSNTSPPLGTCPGGSGSGSGDSNSGGGDNTVAPTSAAATSAANEAPATSQPATVSTPAAGAPSATTMYVSPSDPASSTNTDSPSSASSPGGVFITVSQPADGTEAPVSPPTSAPATSEAASAPVVSEPATEPAASAPASGSSTLITITRPTGGSGDVPTTPTTPSNPETPVPTSGSGSGSAQTAGTACSPEGQWNCIGGSQFQRCASGQWSVVMSMAAGTTCSSSSGSMAFVVHRAKRAGFRRYAHPWRV